MNLQTLEEEEKRKDIPFFGCPGLVILASQADVLRGSSRVPAPISRAGTLPRWGTLFARAPLLSRAHVLQTV